MSTIRRLAAILAADVAGYSRLMGADEVSTLEALKAHRREVIDPAIAASRGRIVKTTGDGLLAEFASAVDAVTCAVGIQEQMARRGGDIRFRIGINIGDIISDGDDIFGDGVNVAARVENECEPGGVCLSDDAHRQVRGKTSFVFDDLGEKLLKNIDRPIRLYSLQIRSVSDAALSVVAESSVPLPLPDKPSIAVLPFQNMSGDPEQEYFADGMVEDIITALSRFKSLFVIARNSSFTYKGKVVDIKQVGRELGVRYVLEGSVRRAGNRLRITGQLIEAATNKHLWADRFEGSLEDVFELQDSVTASVVGAIRPQLVQAEVDAWKFRKTSNLDSYDLFMRAQTRVREGRLADAVTLYRKCAELDPGFAIAYARAANCIRIIAYSELQPVSDSDRALGVELAEEALRLGSDDAEVLAFVSTVFVVLKDAVEQGYDLAVRATDLNPNHTVAWGSRGLASVVLGDHTRALEEFDHALRLNPVDQALVPALHWGKASAFFFLDRYSEGLDCANKILQFRPTHMMGLINVAMQSRLLGREAQAQNAIELLRKTYPGLSGGYLQRQTYLAHYRRSADRTKLLEAYGALGLPE